MSDASDLIEDLVAVCDLCKKTITVESPTELGGWIFHRGCYNIALHRLSRFMEIVLLSEEEFNEWLADDGQ